jgi:hypothetical protein
MGCEPSAPSRTPSAFEILEAETRHAAFKLKKQIARFAKPAIIGTLTGSAAMNAFAFAAQTANPFMTAAAVTLGVAIPALIYALTRVGAALYIDCHSRG